jgi:hypothetical protein
LVGTNVTFDGSKSTGKITNYNWVFGDGSNANLTTPRVTHVYSNQGIYNVTLTVIDKNGLLASDTIKVTVAKNLQLFFHNYATLSYATNSSLISIALANTSQPISNVSNYEKINCLLNGGQQGGQTIWYGMLVFTTYLPENLYIAGSANISFFVNSTDSFSRKQVGEYAFAIGDINATGPVASFSSDIQGGQGNPFTPKPEKITLSIKVDNVFKAEHQICFIIELVTNKKGWSVGVYFDSVGNNSGAVLPVVYPQG